MSILTRAWLYIIRKSFKSLVIFLILATMSSLILSTISIKKSTDALSKETFQNITSSFSMEINRKTNPGTARGAGNLIGEDIEKIKNLPGVKKYIKRMNVSADLVDLEPLKLANHQQEEKNNKQRQLFSKTVIVSGTNDSSLDDRFSAETLKLQEGRHLKDDDKNSVLIHEGFAKKNKVKVGDKIKLKGNPNDADNEKKSDKEVEVTVVGIFGGQNKGVTSSHMELYDNIFIATIVFSIVILSLILFLWINSRRKEIGVSLAIGMTKASIIGQFILEVLLISIPSFIASYFVGSAISQSIGNQILQQSIKSVSKSISSQANGVNLGANAEVEGANKIITALDVSVGLGNMLTVVVVGILIIIVAVGIASSRLAYRKPKDLLSDIN